MTKRNNGKREFEFALVLSGIEVTEELENALFEAGCDDATLSLRHGRVFLTFARQASSLAEAILSAISDVRKAIPAARTERIDECSLVTASEIARKTGRSRQQIHQYIKGQRGPGGFPPPACHVDDHSPLWRWCEVAEWLHANDLAPAQCAEDAELVELINAVLESERLKSKSPDLSKQVLEVIGHR